jgi:NAD(P)-dependent dehydrogenase (short-subunit alcohol dehydrogenase family)
LTTAPSKFHYLPISAIIEPTCVRRTFKYNAYALDAGHQKTFTHDSVLQTFHCLAAAAFIPILPALAYVCTKAALATMTQYFAKEFAPNIRVNAVSPSNIEVPGRPQRLHEAALTFPMRRLGLPEEVASAGRPTV